MSAEFTPEQEARVQERLKEQENILAERFDEVICIEMSWLLRIMKEHYGEEVCRFYVKENGERTRQHWSKKAEEAGDNSIESFLKLQWPLSGKDSEYTVEEDPSGFRFNVTKCRLCEMAKRNGITEQMYYFACEPDPFAAEGFNPNIGFKRTKTLMRGDEYCDHFYYYKDKGEQS